MCGEGSGQNAAPVHNKKRLRAAKEHLPRAQKKNAGRKRPNQKRAQTNFMNKETRDVQAGKGGSESARWYSHLGGKTKRGDRSHVTHLLNTALKPKANRIWGNGLKNMLTGQKR